MQLRKRSLSLRYRAKSGEPLARLLVEAYALVREAGRRTINMRHFDVQILGGIAMFHRSIVEMQTGEGKTLWRPRCRCTSMPWSARAATWPR
jgi:preprotein translocase subunit SecA